MRFARLSLVVAATVLAATPLSAQLPDNPVESNLVTIQCAVTDRSGAPPANLRPGDIQLRDNGQPRELRSVRHASDVPLTLAVLADVSGEQEEYIASHRDVLLAFLKQTLGPRDQAMLVEFGRQTWKVSGVTGSADALAAAVAKMGSGIAKHAGLLGPPCRRLTPPHFCGGEVLWHALDQTASALESAQGRKAIVMLSDGVDSGSDVTARAAIEKVQSVGAVVYTVKFAPSSIHLSVNAALAHNLGRIARETGGLSFGGNPDALDRVASDLRAMYVLGFIPPDAARDGKFHNVDLKATIPGVSVRAQPGYLAKAPGR